MELFLAICIVLIALEHLFIGLLEMFGKKESQAKAFGFPGAELENQHLRLALSNQGIYNLAFGLVMIGLLVNHAGFIVWAYLLGFVVCVGLYGGATVSKKIWLIQAMPAAIVLVLLILTR
ncbi:DUF1304 domain-containing protein [Lactococcus kimchii]|uniref:DUF1304 domain-containing protein n=1 Tax=Lactococcus sp. S-13 TaxID=2507158 RepID=UPI001023C833|nr:DUF1304 domain-containing protein [Lactococcus sp. S-13]RZI49265.1 DUF1304 domain-containing protein [Lactococcus sp. S-13]